ncbi:MAG: hypothetical protein AB1894_08725 [Chloroflexota bacterium]
MKRIKRVMLLLALLSLSMLGASPWAGGRPAVLTVINKSGMVVEISLSGANLENAYYLRVPTGDRTVPTVKTFEIVRDQYASTLYYVELWDPVYGYSCSRDSQQLDLTRNVRVVVTECDRNASAPGEPSMLKYGAPRHPRSPQPR